jgi:multidrug efflux pump subunit AcrB
LLANPEDMGNLEAATEKAKALLATYDGVFDIYDDSAPGKVEFQITVKEDARAMGLTLADIAGTVRAAYYGEEVMRLQRGRHEVKLMVRYPPEERKSLANFDEIRVRAGDGAERPLTELAKIKVEQGYSQITRMDQLRAITITADVDEKQANARNITDELKKTHIPKILEKYPEVSVRWEGQAEQTRESILGLMIGLGIALVAMFALLTLEFRSYMQPLLILFIIPFGFVGAVVGHLVLGLPLTLFSLFGLVALTGVVVNDSIVLIDFINRRVRDGVPLKEALLDAGRRRFRPVMLTSMTTIAGLLPIMLERSLQAQVVIPMATSLAFGLLFTTLLVLILVPTFYLIYARIIGVGVDTHEEADPLPPPLPSLPLDADKDDLEVLSP